MGFFWCFVRPLGLRDWGCGMRVQTLNPKLQASGFRRDLGIRVLEVGFGCDH